MNAYSPYTLLTTDCYAFDISSGFDIASFAGGVFARPDAVLFVFGYVQVDSKCT